MTREELIEDIKKTIPVDAMNAFVRKGGDLNDVANRIENNLTESTDDFAVICLTIIYQECKR